MTSEHGTPTPAAGPEPTGCPVGHPAGGGGTAGGASDPRRASRRRFLGGAALTAAGAAAGVAASTALRGPSPVATAAPLTLADLDALRAQATVPFYGEHQAGITTAQQDRLMFASFDLVTGDPVAVAHLLGTWAAMAARFTAGQPVRSGDVRPEQPPPDTGEASDLGPYSLTVTVGFGPGMFDERFGLAAKMPAALRPLDQLPGDSVLRPEISGGDLCVQACADDPQVVFHAIRNFARAARGVATMRWSQLGFGRASSTGAGQSTPRNLFGFKDGTNNIHADDTAATAAHVWVDASTDQPWMVGGSYLVARKIRMEIQSWDAAPLADQERTFGRVKTTGAPLSGGTEFTPLDLAAVAGTGSGPAIDVAAHARLASPEENGGVRMLRRGYNYTDGQDSRTGLLDAGLFFICFQRDAHEQFSVVQTRLGSSDLMNEYVAHVSSALFAVPPGLTGPGDWYGKALFDL
ncbi:iron uptake transporter deferrochelatase/peroxidase subunit [Nakamurella deserti]|uniref:iron uptake transporter deferrochelatase/peroxidase subunit n=1 Tax=Nakamurella deserti TaxID=2164074 RepID=UPI000DBE48F4|nr:iron uptake transporter deferrochelatase/peroxidase subunit [Nakamurella deserti]